MRLSRSYMKKKILTYIYITLFLMVLVLPTLLWVTIGRESDSSLEEKRTLNSFPSPKSGFIPLFELWYKDHTPYRSVMIESYNLLNSKAKDTYVNEIRPFLSPLFTPAWFEGEEYLAPMIENAAIYGTDDWLFYSGDNSIGYYEGTNIMTDEEMESVLDTYESLNEKCLKRGIDLIYAVPPNKEQVFPEYMPTYNVRTEYKREEVLEDYIKKHSSIHYLYLLDDMLSIKEKYAPYYKEDTHWNNAGAFTGVMAIYRELGYPYISIDDVNVSTYKQYGGDLTSMSGYGAEYDAYNVDYKSDVTYSVELYADGWVEKYSSTNKNGKTLVMISDSFRIASRQYLAKDYEYSYICHRGYVSDDVIVDAIKNLKEGDTLLIMPVERFDGSNVGVSDFVSSLLE